MRKKLGVHEITNLKLDAYHILLNEALFHNSNGYIGIRYDFEEGYPEGYEFLPSQYINGFYDYSDMKQAEKLFGLVEKKQVMLNIANTQSINLFIDGEEFSMFSGTLITSKLWLDMVKGTNVRDVIWRSPKGKEIHIIITRMTSFYQLPLFTIEYLVEPINFSGEVVLVSGHDVDVKTYFDNNDPRIANTGIKGARAVSCEIIDGASYITSRTIESNLEVCSCVKNVLSKDCHEEFLVSESTASCSLKTHAEQGEIIKLIKYAVFCDSIRYEDCRSKASLEIQKAVSIPLKELYKRQQDYMADYWRNCYVEIESQDEMDMALNYNLYQLIQSVGKDKYCNIAPKGLSGDGYEGQYFWDSEIYVQAFFTITNPSISKTLIEYRYETLDLARENAKILGHCQGALYPWRTIMGRECSGYFPSGTAQYHINGDVAYSIINYYLATKDIEFILEKGAEIIFETVRVWISTGDYYKGKFHINNVTGPDEYTCLVNNNYYTNVLAQYHLNWAVKLYYLLKKEEGFYKLIQKIELKDEEINNFKKAAENMYLPYDEELKINPQDDSFLQKKEWDIKSIPKDKFPMLLHYHPLHLYRYKICKQADTVLAHFILEDAQSEETMLNSFNYYEKITTHDSSLSKCIFCIMAAKFGMKEKAMDYFEDSMKLDLMDKHHNTKDGIHIANMAGNYMAIVYGFGGFRLKESGIYFAPILPQNWSGYSFEICFEDSRILIIVKKDEYIFNLELGSEKKINVFGREYLLKDRITINASTNLEHSYEV